jgi:acyl carrier protein
MSERDILAGLEQVAREHLGYAGTLAAEQRLVEELGLDSLRLLILAAEVENRFRVRLEPDEEAGIVTVGDLVRLVAGKLAGAAR